MNSIKNENLNNYYNSINYTPSTKMYNSFIMTKEIFSNSNEDKVETLYNNKIIKCNNEYIYNSIQDKDFNEKNYHEHFYKHNSGHCVFKVKNKKDGIKEIKINCKLMTKKCIPINIYNELTSEGFEFFKSYCP